MSQVGLGGIVFHPCLFTILVCGWLCYSLVKHAARDRRVYFSRCQFHDSLLELAKIDMYTVQYQTIT